MAIDLTCDISSKRITPGVINLKEFENGTTSMVWTVSSRYTTGLVDLNDFDAYLNLSIRGHIDQIKLTKVLNVDDSISLTWDVGTLSTFLVGYAKYQIVFKAIGSGSLYVNCPTDANANGTYTVQNPEAIQSLRTYKNDNNYRIFIGASGKWTLEDTSAFTVAYQLIESIFPAGDNWNNCTVADTTAAVFNTYEALMYVSESIASDPSMMAQFPTMLRQWELLLSDKIMSSGLNAVRYEVTESMFTANSGTDPTYFLMLEDIDTTGKPGLIIGAEAFKLEGSAYYTQIANCNFSDNWAGSAGITVPEAFNGYVVVYYSEGGGQWVQSAVHTSIDATVPPVEVKIVTKINADISRRLGTIDSSVTTLICVLNPLPDEIYEHEYRFKFSTADTLGISAFKVVGPSVAAVATANDLSSKVIKFTATQLNSIYALVADQILVDATLSVTYTAETHTLSVGAETLVLDGLSDSDVYFVCDTNFGTVTALGSVVPSVFESVTWMQSAPSLLPSKTYEFSVVDNCAIFVGSV
ncbi:MAG: hypothetical protein M0R48_10285 [Candidatus Omnitrophica bacterium]|nr:hypothetical protein [Candidatus Omnitrophota bacterium]